MAKDKHITVIKGRFPALNDFLKAVNANRFAGSSMKKEQTEFARLHFLRHKKFQVPVHIDIQWYELNNKRDSDNIVFAKKWLFDGMVNAKVMPDDSRKWVKGWSEAVHTDKKNPRIVVTVTEWKDYEKEKEPRTL